MRHSIVRFPNGTASLRPDAHDAEASGEAMHSAIGPWEEARLIYLGQAGLPERLLEQCNPELVIYDLGMGTAANALAALEAAAGARRRLRILSFETDLDGPRAALANAEEFPYLARHARLLEELLDERRVERPGLLWELIEGDFTEKLPCLLEEGRAPRPELVFYDLYSPAVAERLWGFSAFDLLARACQGGPSLLLTYSAATAVRSALLLAGFEVGRGTATPLKKETTVAWLGAAPAGVAALGEEWLAHLERSSKPLPADCPWPRPEALQRIQGRLHKTKPPEA